MKTALFVDFDNIFSSLRNEGGEAVALRFANDPARWVRWLESVPLGVQGPSGSVPTRRILIRTCYLNPSLFGRHRSAFTAAAFRVVDCPRVTAQGKNSADIHMVMDVLDTLAHPTRFDEFILLSGDADFRPVLLRLRAHDRRTAILTVGPSSAAYEAASDHIIRYDEFIERALGFGDGGAPEPRVGQERASSPEAPPPLAPRAPPGADAIPLAPDPQALRRQVLEELRRLVGQAGGPVPLARVGQVLNGALGERIRDTNWLGYGSLRRFLETFPESGFRLRSVGAGFLYDPTRHEAPGGAEEERGLLLVIERVCRETGAPRRTSEEYRKLFEAIDEALQEAPYQLMDTSRRVRDRCVARGQVVPRGDAVTVLKALWNARPSLLRRDGEARSPMILATAYSEALLALCGSMDLDLTPPERDLLGIWITGGFPVEDATMS